MADAYQVVRAFCSLSHRLPISGFGRVCYVDLLGSSVDQNVLPGMLTLKVSAAAFVDPPADHGDLLRIEPHSLTVRRVESSRQRAQKDTPSPQSSRAEIVPGMMFRRASAGSGRESGAPRRPSAALSIP